VASAAPAANDVILEEWLNIRVVVIAGPLSSYACTAIAKFALH
jgi:hypothetical protein